MIPAGQLLEKVPPHFKISWTNNLTNDVGHEKKYQFKLSEIDNSIWEAQKDIIFYLRLTDTNSKSQTFAFDMISFNLNNKPTISFDVEKNKTALSIKNYETTGHFNTNNLFWDWGNGYSSTQDRVPAPYTYVSPNDYNISLTTKYGNSDFQKCVEKHTQKVSIKKQDFDALPCQTPSWVKQLEATASQMKLEYSPVYEAQKYNIRYKPTADIDGKWQTTSSTQNTVTLPNLEPNTQYNVQVKCDCSNKVKTKQESQWSYLSHFFSMIK